MRSRRLFWLTLLVALPVLVSAVVTTFGITRVLDGIAVSVNEQENQRTWQAVQSAMSSTRSKLGTLVSDNANWNDSIPHVYGEFDAAWVEQMWGVYSGDGNYDTIAIATSEGETLASYASGEKTQVTAAQLLGAQFGYLLKDIPRDGTFKVVTTLADTPFGLSVIAAAPMVPTEDIDYPADRPHILIYSRFLTPAVLADLGKEYAIDGFALQSIVPGTPAGPQTLRDSWGADVATAAWQPRLPGNAAQAEYGWIAIAVLTSLLAAMLPISIIHLVTLRRLDRKEREAKAEARRDLLSGIANRLFFGEELAEKLKVAPPGELSLLFIDLDGFKAVNDAYGHDTGDALIRAFTRTVEPLIKPGETLARLGGDEFAVIVSGARSQERAEDLARLIIATVRTPFNLDGKIASIGASVGIATLGTNALQPSEFMRRADVALYDAKAGGRNTWRVFDVGLDAVTVAEFEIATEMRDLIARSAFDVAYQPIVLAGGRTIVGVEALARWPKSSAREVKPDQFIRIAEEHGFIDKLGAHILDMACRDMAGLPDIRLSVNLSPLQLSNPLLVKDIMRIAEQHGMPLSRLEVEFTEAVVIKNARKAKQVIAELQREGIKVALDDFGTGYASVGYLREFSFDKVKLDRSLTQHVWSSPDTHNVVQGTALIAKGMSAELIAEGVETEEEARLMHLIGCSQMQGFHFGRPQPIEALRNGLKDKAAAVSV